MKESKCTNCGWFGPTSLITPQKCPQCGESTMVPIDENKKHTINPMKTSVFPAKEDLARLKLHIAIFDKLDSDDTRKLLNTCQWLFEVIDRMEDHENWWLINAPDDLKDQHRREVLGISDKEWKKMMDDGNNRIKEMLKKLRPNGRKGK